MGAPVAAELARASPRRRLAQTLAEPGPRLFLVATTILFVEILLIRWIPANVVYVGYFSNFILIGSFLGIGVGILLGRRGVRLPISPFAPALLAIVVLVSWARFDFQLASTEEVFFGLTDRERQGASFLVLPLAVVLTAVVLAALALPLGPLFRAMPPLRAYAFDIAGSLTGIALAIGLSALSAHILWWFVLAAVLVWGGELLSGGRARSTVVAAILVAVVGLVFVTQPAGERWSPYYRVQVIDAPGGWTISVNGIGHQRLWPTEAPEKEPFYEQAYRWFPDRTFGRVLVIGAGSGSDVAIALSRGATHVDAVEIDPVILQTGVRLHPDRPYDDPRVERHLDDGRAFLGRTESQYDLIVYALPDSLVLASRGAAVRLESFLFTREAFEDVRARLAPDGVFMLYNYYREPWLAGRLAATLEDVFGAPPLFRHYPELCCYAAALAAQARPAAAPTGDQVDPLPAPTGRATALPRDDWPFPYLRAPGVPDHYLAALGLILLFAGVAVGGSARVTGLRLSGFSPHFFVLGAAFLLLETRSLVTFGLLFGTTWLVNALVFFAILASILAAIALNARFRPDPRLLYGGLFTSLAIGYALPPASLLIDPPEARYLVASALAFAPVFFANLVFAYSFRDTRAADMAFASNLIGMVVGGVLEYSALVTGYQALLLIVAALYLAALLLARRWRFLADRHLRLT